MLKYCTCIQRIGVSDPAAAGDLPSENQWMLANLGPTCVLSDIVILLNVNCLFAVWSFKSK